MTSKDILKKWFNEEFICQYSIGEIMDGGPYELRANSLMALVELAMKMEREECEKLIDEFPTADPKGYVWPGDISKAIRNRGEK